MRAERVFGRALKRLPCSEAITPSYVGEGMRVLEPKRSDHILNK